MEDDLAYQEKTWEELTNGKIIAMSSRSMFDHNRVASNIAYIFEPARGINSARSFPRYRSPPDRGGTGRRPRPIQMQSLR